MTLQSLAAGHPARPRIGHILEAGERASALTAQLMTFSRKQITQTRQMSLNDLVRDVSGLLRRLIREDVELEFVTAPGLCPVKADATQMQQVVMNLCLNARDAIQGAGRIRVETAEAVVRETVTPPAGDPVPPGEYAVLSVSDNGAGMDDFVLHHLFEPFFTTKDQGRGTGLGLPTVYGAVRQNGGYITVTSEVSKGTTVRMYLPRLEDEPSRQCSAEVAPAPPTRERATVLLVEDEPQLRALARTILESSGYQVRDAPNGQAALEIARTQASFDLVVTDVVMPGMSGAELARRIRGADSTTRVLFMSGHARNHVSENDLDDPGTGYLQKPFSADDLLAAAGRLLTHESRSVRPPNRV
jgi:CheY-like chemotaxis protein